MYWNWKRVDIAVHDCREGCLGGRSSRAVFFARSSSSSSPPRSVWDSSNPAPTTPGGTPLTMSSDPLFASFAKPSASTPTPPTPTPPTLKKRQISPPAPAATESAKKARVAEEAAAASLDEPAKKFVDADEFETEATTAVPGSVGLGGGEPEGLILSHQVSLVTVVWCSRWHWCGGSSEGDVARAGTKGGSGLPCAMRRAAERAVSLAEQYQGIVLWAGSIADLVNSKSPLLPQRCACLQPLANLLPAGPPPSRPPPSLPLHSHRLARPAR